MPDADFVGGPQPLPAVSRGTRFPAPCRSARGRSILASEQALEVQSDGRGWARNMVNRLCIDLTGRVSEPCTRDNVKESYLTPTEHPVTVRLTGAVPVGATCAWSFDDGDGAAAIHPRLRRADQFPRALWPPHRRHRRCLQRSRGAAAHLDRDHGARHLHRRARRQHRIGRRQSGPADRAVGRGLLLPLLFRDCQCPILPSKPRRLQRRARLRSAGFAAASGSARARSGSIPPAIARCTATRPAPRWRSPCNTRTSR